MYVDILVVEILWKGHGRGLKRQDQNKDFEVVDWKLKSVEPTFCGVNTKFLCSANVVHKTFDSPTYLPYLKCHISITDSHPPVNLDGIAWGAIKKVA